MKLPDACAACQSVGGFCQQRCARGGSGFGRRLTWQCSAVCDSRTAFGLPDVPDVKQIRAAPFAGQSMGSPLADGAPCCELAPPDPGSCFWGNRESLKVTHLWSGASASEPWELRRSCSMQSTAAPTNASAASASLKLQRRLMGTAIAPAAHIASSAWRAHVRVTPTQLVLLTCMLHSQDGHLEELVCVPANDGDSVPAADAI